MMCERALSRQSHGKVIAEHQMVQEQIADSWSQYHMLRLLVLWTAWTIDNSSTREARTQIAMCKTVCAEVQKDIVFRAIHMLGSLGVTHLTPLQAHVGVGPDPVHHGRTQRGPQGDHRPQRAEGLPAPRGQLADRVLAGQAGGGQEEVRRPCWPPMPSWPARVERIEARTSTSPSHERCRDRCPGGCPSRVELDPLVPRRLDRGSASGRRLPGSAPSGSVEGVGIANALFSSSAAATAGFSAAPRRSRTIPPPPTPNGSGASSTPWKAPPSLTPPRSCSVRTSR